VRQGDRHAAPELASLRTLTRTLYMQDPSPLACSSDGSDGCLAECTTTLGARGRVCAQCLIDQTLPTKTCINDDCDCEPVFDDDPTFGCAELCDAV
jgi:hypothetical protein